MPKDDAWDWPVLLYVATVTLKRSEAEFWRITPRKLNALTRAHIKMNQSGEDKEQQQPGFIDQVM